MKRWGVAGAVLMVWAMAARASEEDILPTERVVIVLVADGRSFGKISARIETEADGPGRKVKVIVLRVDGRKHAVPAEDLTGLKNPLLNTAEFRTEAGRDGGPPWLYLTFRLHRARALPSQCPLVYVRFRDGKLAGCVVRDPQAK